MDALKPINVDDLKPIILKHPVFILKLPGVLKPFFGYDFHRAAWTFRLTGTRRPGLVRLSIDRLKTQISDGSAESVLKNQIFD